MPFLNLIRLPRLLVNAACVVTVTLLLLLASSTLFSTLFARVYAADIHTLDFSARRGQPAPNCVELVVNGGFEQTAVGWNSMAGASLFTYAADQYVGGQHSLFLGFTSPLNITATFGAEQFLSLPAESSRIDFAFHYDVVVAGQVDGKVSPGDQAYVTFYDTATNQLAAMLVLSPTRDAWIMGRYDLTPLAGKNVRLAFAAQNDGEPGSLAMRVDDVSILACLPVEAFALQPLPTPTPQPTGATAPLILSPQALPTASPPPTSAPITATAITPQIPGVPQPTSLPQSSMAPQTQSVFPQTGTINSLDACSCTGALYACSDFSNWSVAQACYMHCQVTAGYDIHNLDEDRNGIACELELQDVASLEAPLSPQATPSLITETNVISSNAPVAAVGAVTTVVSPSVSSPGQPAQQVTSLQSSTLPTTGTSPILVAPAVTMTIANSGATAITNTTAMTTMESTTLPVPSTAAIASVPADNALLPNAPSPASTLSSIELLALLLFSPLGYLAIGALLIVGSLSLWVAYMVGQRGRPEKRYPINQNGAEDFVLQPTNEISVHKT